MDDSHPTFENLAIVSLLPLLSSLPADTFAANCVETTSAKVDLVSIDQKRLTYLFNFRAGSKEFMASLNKRGSFNKK
jgi:hypothetical protein